MRALTLKQPWLYAIEHLGKRVENRSWAIPFNLRGQWIALHAGKANQRAEWVKVFEIHGEMPPFNLTFGAVTSVAMFGSSILTDSHRLRPSKQKWFFGPKGWLITDLLLLEEPLPCRGMLGLWTIPNDIEMDIRRQINNIQKIV